MLRAGDRKGDDGDRSRFLERFRERIDRGTCRYHVVDDRDPSCAEIASDTKGTRDVLAPRGRAQVRLRSCCDSALDAGNEDGPAKPASELLRYLIGLIVAALPEPPRVQRNGDERIDLPGPGRKGGSEEQPERPPERALAAELERLQLARERLPVSKRGGDEVDVPVAAAARTGRDRPR